MLANNRKHKVIGRTIILMSSTILRNGTKYQGEFLGRTEDTVKYLLPCSKIPLNQNNKAALKLKPNLVVTG